MSDRVPPGWGELDEMHVREIERQWEAAKGSRVQSYDVTELIDLVPRPDGSMRIEPIGTSQRGIAAGETVVIGLDWPSAIEHGVDVTPSMTSLDDER